MVGGRLGALLGWLRQDWVSIGFADDASVPLLALTLVDPIAVAAALVIASGPAWWAARTRPASILRTE